jgi:uncharacterized membrane protein
MQLLVLIVLCSIFYACFEIFAALAGGKVNGWLAAVLYNGIGTVIPLVVYFASKAKGKTSWRGIIYAGLAGIAIMLFSVLLARIFNKGGNLAYVIPAIYGIAILLSSLFGWLLLKEKVSGLQAAGLGLIMAGVVCVVVAKLKTA